MKVWHIILIAVLLSCFTMLIIKHYKNDKELIVKPFVKNDSDSLYKVIDSLVAIKDSLITEIQTLEKNKKKVIIKYHEKDNNIRNLNADSSISLFAKWNRQLQDSTYQKRYFWISADTIY
jgi:beta-lactamase class D